MRFSYKNRIVEFLNHPDFRSCVYINILARNYIKAEILLPTYSRDVPCTKTVSFVLLNFGFSKSQRCNSNLTEGIQVCTYVSSSYAAKSRNSAYRYAQRRTCALYACETQFRNAERDLISVIIWERWFQAWRRSQNCEICLPRRLWASAHNGEISRNYVLSSRLGRVPWIPCEWTSDFSFRGVQTTEIHHEDNAVSANLEKVLAISHDERNWSSKFCEFSTRATQFRKWFKC